MGTPEIPVRSFEETRSSMPLTAHVVSTELQPEKDMNVIYQSKDFVAAR